MNIIDIADYKKHILAENDSALVSSELTPHEIDQVNELLVYFHDIEDGRSAFKILCSITNILSHELLCSSSDSFMAPLNDNHSL